MARQPRVDFEGAVHHVMNRGAAHQDIFSDDKDRKMFLDLWARTSAKFDLEIVSHCLMGNHFHFLVVSQSGQLSRALQFVSQTYTQRFNARHDRDGALFRGRFHSVLVDSDAYFERVGRYIELNPVAAGLVPLTRLDTYRWSSFQYYTGHRRTPSWLSTKRMLDRYSSRDQYTKFVQSDLSDTELDRFYERQLRPGVVLGRPEFVQHVRRTQQPNTDLIAGLPALSQVEIDNVVSRLAGCEVDTLLQARPGAFATARRVAIELSNMITDASHSDLAEHYRYPTPNAAGSAIRASRTSTKADLKELRRACLDALGLDENGHRRRG